MVGGLLIYPASSHAMRSRCGEPVKGLVACATSSSLIVDGIDSGKHEITLTIKNQTKAPIQANLSYFTRAVSVRIENGKREVLTAWGIEEQFMPTGEGPIPPSKPEDYSEIPGKGFVEKKFILEDHIQSSGANRHLPFRKDTYALIVRWRPYEVNVPKFREAPYWSGVLDSALVLVEVK